MDSEEFFARPAEQYRELLAFLGLRSFEPSSFGRYNARPGEPMAAEVRGALEKHYAPHNERLAHLLDRPPKWAH
jgi:hypothetical protein